jgi:hypothetical protein
MGSQHTQPPPPPAEKIEVAAVEGQRLISLPPYPTREVLGKEKERAAPQVAARLKGYDESRRC